MEQSLEIKRTFRRVSSVVALALGTIGVSSREVDSQVSPTVDYPAAVAFVDAPLEAAETFDTQGAQGSFVAFSEGALSEITAYSSSEIFTPQEGQLAPAVRGERIQEVPIPEAPPELWNGYENTYACKNGFGPTGRTPCCPQWWETATDVGWPIETLPKLDYIMARESGCNPNATGTLYRGIRAIGLTQLYGWGGSEMYNPVNNLTKALELFVVSGEQYGNPWKPWCLDGDYVTGSC